MAAVGSRTSLKKLGTCKVMDLKFEVSTKSLCCSLFWRRHLPSLPPNSAPGLTQDGWHVRNSRHVLARSTYVETALVHINRFNYCINNVFDISFFLVYSPLQQSTARAEPTHCFLLQDSTRPKLSSCILDVCVCVERERDRVTLDPHLFLNNIWRNVLLQNYGNVSYMPLSSVISKCALISLSKINLYL